MEGAKVKLLLVEDEVVLALAEKASLERFCYTVEVAHDCERAVERALADPEIQLVLMDIDLGGGMDGTEAAAAILRTREVPIVFYSSHAEPDIVARTEKVASYGYILKGSNPIMVDASIKIALRLAAANHRNLLVERGRSALAALVENTRDIAIVKDPDRRIVTGNTNFVRASGRTSLAELVGLTDAEILGLPEEAEPVRGYKADDLAALALPPGECIEREEVLPMEGNRPIALHTRKFPIYSEGKVIGLGVITMDVSEQNRVEAKHREQERLLTMVMETSPVGITTVDAAGNITYANARAEQILGIVKGEITARSYNAPLWRSTDVDGGPFADDQHPFSIVKATGKPAYDVRQGIEWPDGRRVILSINASPMQDDSGGFLGMVATIEDITARIANERAIIEELRDKGVLLKEVHHRIKNNLASIEALLGMQMREIENPEAIAALRDAAGRVESMRLLYEKLLIGDEYAHLPAGAYLGSLADAVLALFPQGGAIRVVKRFEDFELSPKTLFPLGIILNELLTNICKYAFRDRAEGLVEIDLARVGAAIRLEIYDDGVGLPPGFDPGTSGGFGLTLVRMLSQQLGGTFTVEGRAGTRSVVEFPAP